MSIELLQEIGLNKYEAEAYTTLLAQGPLTGYELGKRSQIPLSRSYDVLERLSQKGLALVQPGDPARYKALEPALFLGQVRSSMEQTLATLAQTLTGPASSSGNEDFWVIRGLQHILSHIQALCISAQHHLCLALPESLQEEIAGSLSQLRQRAVSIVLAGSPTHDAARVLLIVDGQVALLGTLEPSLECQAIVSHNPALLAALSSYFAPAQQERTQLPVTSSTTEQTQLDWQEWEKRKQQRLRKDQHDQRIA